MSTYNDMLSELVDEGSILVRLGTPQSSALIMMRRERDRLRKTVQTALALLRNGDAATVTNELEAALSLTGGA